MLVPSGALYSVRAPAAELAYSSVFSLKLAYPHLGGGKENEVAGKLRVRQGGGIWLASTLLLALPVDARWHQLRILTSS